MNTFRVMPLLVMGFFLASASLASGQDSSKLEYFEKHVRPIFVNHCHACHSAETKPAGGMRVDDRNGLVVGGNNGPAIVPGKPKEGLLFKRVANGSARQMPLEGEKLNAEQIKILQKWVEDGAIWPAIKLPFSLGQSRPTYEKLKKEHWSLQPVSKADIPNVKDNAWSKSNIDRFILSGLEKTNLRPVKDADKASLIRRLSFDLTGLPPTPAQVESFLQDSSPKAVENLVDSLLASKAYGENWGRHWLDVARYGESTGPSRNIPYPFAWRYRDYVIDSFNADIAFNRFVQEQIAGDLLPAKDADEANRLKIATGFLALGVKDVNQRFKTRFIMDNVDEQIDVVTRSVLGLTASCARCHDHKFDPIPTTDYYALAGIFTSTENASGLRNLMGGGGLAYYVPENLVKLEGKIVPASSEKVEKLQQQVAEAKKIWDEIRGTPEGLKPDSTGQPSQRKFRTKYESLQSELLSLTDPAQRGLAAHGVRDSKVIADTEIRVRGEAEKLGPVWPRGFLTAINVPDAKPVNKEQSGRLELALWMTSDTNPLASRVIVNRVWSKLFGRGIVSTVDNFGSTGDQPSNQELLDYLASHFVQDGWSIKRLVRSIVLSRVYQLSSESTEKHLELDPSNKLVWRHAPRRLSAEEFRDALLGSSGRLNSERPEGSYTKSMRMVEIRDNGQEAKQIHEASDKSNFRAIYLPLLRGLTPRTLETFDPAEQTLVTGVRDTTTVPTQALFLLNSAFVRKHSLALAEKLLKDEKTSFAEKVNLAYRFTLGRVASEYELDRALQFLAEYESLYREKKSNSVAVKIEQSEEKTVKKNEEKPIDPDQADQSNVSPTEEVVVPSNPRSAAWLALVQALYGSAEFRFVK